MRLGSAKHTSQMHPKSNLSPSLSSTIKRAKLKHNNVFVNKLVNMMRFHSSIYNIILLYVYSILV